MKLLPSIKSPADVISNLPSLALYALVFLLPLWFLPITQDIFNFQKQTLLILLVLVGVVAWLAKTINKKEVSFRKSWVHIAVLGVVVVVAVSSITSIWRYGSLWGWPLNVSDSFL